jgi:adenylate cyclase
LYQNVLYRRLSAGRRSHLHLQIAVRMENGFGERAREIAAELAMHFTHAQDLHRAARYHQQAGVSALQRSAPQQAFEHLRRALELLLSTPDTAQRRQQELSLQSDLGVSIIAGQGYTAPEVGQAFARALQLCEALGDDAPLPSILWGLFLFRLIRAEFDSALGYGEKLLELAQTHSDPGLSLQARLALGAVLLFRGEFPAAQMHFDEGLDLCDLAPPNFAAVLHTQNLRVECTATAAWLLWMRGYPDQARQRAAQALSLAREAQSPNSLAVALYRQAVLHQLLGYGELAYTGATELLRHSREHGLPHWEMAAIVLLGAEEVAQKADASAIPRMQKAIAARNSMGVGLGATLDLALLADAHRRLGQSEAGLQIVAEARSLIDAKGERLHESWLHLIEGELWVCGSVPQTDKAESCFRRAIEVAGRQGARSWALRAASGLGRLCKRTGRMQEARTAIASVYQEFTEGFDTGDLRQARSLLDE